MYFDLIDEIRSIILEAGKIAVKNFGKIKYIKRKEDKSPVSNVDQEISDFIVGNLKRLTPGIPVISEEGESFPADYMEDFWLIDPIDGTWSYINEEESYTINIALIKEQLPVMGFIYQPAKDLLYYTANLSTVIVEDHSICYCLSNFTDKTNLPVIAAVSSRLSKRLYEFIEKYKINDVISIPSSIKLCMVAEGTADIYPRLGRTMEWDTAAGHAILKAVGGQIFCTDGAELKYGKKNFENPHFFACNKYIIDSNFLK